MKNATLITFSISTTILAAVAAVSYAEPSSSTPPRMPAIRDALEVSVGAGWAQGSGDVDGTSTNVDDIAGAGINTQLQIGYRITPNLALAAYGSVSVHEDGSTLTASNNDVVGVTTGLQADWHFQPRSEIDPWISLGAGTRWLVTDDNAGGEHVRFGLDVARLQAGVDYRITPTFALGPVVGVSATTFLREYDGMTDSSSDIDDPSLSFHVHAGLLGRFDTPLSQ
jgi:outer membrane protein W